MSKASIETYLTQLNSSKTETVMDRMYRFIKLNPKCDKNEIIKELKLPHQTVTARLSDLLDKGMVKISGQKKLINSTLSMFTAEEDVMKIQENIDLRKKGKLKKWVNKGIKHFPDLLPDSVLSGLLLIEK